jgi:ATP-dependent DNA ligase
VAFDLLCRSDFDLSRLPLRERRVRLEDQVRGSRWSSLYVAWRRTAWRPGTEVLASGYEGLVAKDDASPYEGGKTKRWVKVQIPELRIRRIGGAAC